MEKFANWELLPKIQDNKYGIENSAKLIDWAGRFLSAVRESIADGKIQWYEAVSLGAKSIGGIDALKNISEITKELTNLSAGEVAELTAMLQSRFGFSQDVGELISWLGELVEFVQKTAKLLQ